MFEKTKKKFDRLKHCIYFKIVYEIDSLQNEIDNRRRNIPQTYQEAINRTETIQEINRLYDVRENFFPID